MVKTILKIKRDGWKLAKTEGQELNQTWDYLTRKNLAEKMQFSGTITPSRGCSVDYKIFCPPRRPASFLDDKMYLEITFSLCGL
jgi:hypothetical protein